MGKSVLILGAGLAGLSAAVYLTRAGHRVIVLEKRPFAGGRTFSFKREFWSHDIDNGPHLMLGCYETLLELLDITGGRELLDVREGLRIPFLFPGGDIATLADSNLPAPFHLIRGLYGFSALTPKQKYAIARAFIKVRMMAETEELDRVTSYDWLVGQRQDETTRAVFWRPLVLATLNENPETVSFLQLFRVLKLGFLAGRDAARLILISKGLSNTLIRPCESWLKDKGSSILFGYRVEGMEPEEKTKRVIVQTNKKRFEHYDAVVCALPFSQLKTICAKSTLGSLIQFDFESMVGNAIINLHFWYPERLVAEPMANLQGIRSHWIFVQESSHELVHHVLVISGADELLREASKEGLAELLLEELPIIFPGFSMNLVEHRYLVVEKDATLICRPDMERLRPSPGKILSAFYIAGDWTRTGLPPTMESAVRSGKMVAEKIIAESGADPD